MKSFLIAVFVFLVFGFVNSAFASECILGIQQTQDFGDGTGAFEITFDISLMNPQYRAGGACFAGSSYDDINNFLIYDYNIKNLGNNIYIVSIPRYKLGREFRFFFWRQGGARRTLLGYY